MYIINVWTHSGEHKLQLFAETNSAALVIVRHWECRGYIARHCLASEWFIK